MIVSKPEAIVSAIIGCPAADALRYPVRTGGMARAGQAVGEFLHARDLGSRSRRIIETITKFSPGVLIVGPAVVYDDEARRVARRIPHVLDLSNNQAAGILDPRRRSMREEWFSRARSASETILDVLGHEMPEPFASMIRSHAPALQHRLKTDIALRLRRLEMSIDLLEMERIRGARILIIEGDVPMADQAAALALFGGDVRMIGAPISSIAARRQFLRYAATTEAALDPAPLAKQMRAWKPATPPLGDVVVVAADLRNEADFRHAPAVRSLLDAVRRTERKAVLLQPYTRTTVRTLRAVRDAQGRGARVILTRQPQASGLHPQLAPLRMAMLEILAKPLYSAGPPEQHASVLEAAGGFLVSSLGPSLALAESLARTMRLAPPRFATSIPLGSPFGALVVSAAHHAGTPSLEVQTLMIGESERDPAPIADRISVLDTEQRSIFQRRFDVQPERFMLGGRLGGTPHMRIGHTDGVGVLFASQPLNVSATALEDLARACATRGLRLHVAPHPDETAEDLARYAQILDRYPGLDGQILERGSGLRVLPDYRLLATVISNMALWAAAQNRDVLMLDVGTSMPLDFARMGLAVKAAGSEEIAATLDDVLNGGPLSRALAMTRKQYFDLNPQLRDGQTADRILDEMARYAAIRNDGSNGSHASLG